MLYRSLAAAALSLAFLCTAAQSATAAEKTPAAAAEIKLAPHETAIYVGDMHCATCAKKISGKLFRVKGVMKVRTNVKQHVAIVTPQSKKVVDVKAAWKAVQSAGFEPVKLIGPEGTFVSEEKSKEPVKDTESAPAEQS
ncbi:MAG: heavy metal transporter [Pirellula sp.]|nr:heavy metal transporter [Pirellula sp.]